MTLNEDLNCIQELCNNNKKMLHHRYIEHRYYHKTLLQHQHINLYVINSL